MELDDRQQLRHASRELAEVAREIYDAFASKHLPDRLCCDLTIEMIKMQMVMQAQSNVTEAVDDLMKKIFPGEDGS